jgi:hypothetical protein
MSPLIPRSRESGVSEDEVHVVASWFETRLPALVTMRV